jgi:hypothetical protein
MKAFNHYVVTTEQGDRELFSRVFRAPLGCGFTSQDAQVFSKLGTWVADTAEYRTQHKHYSTYGRAHAAMVKLAAPATVRRALSAALRCPGIWSTDQNTGRVYGEMIREAIDVVTP